MTPEEIIKKFEVINSSYEIGEPFRKEDSKFVKEYAKSVNQKSASCDFDETKTSNGVTAN